MRERRIWRNFDWVLFIAVALLVVFGVVMIYSATRGEGDAEVERAWLNQAFTGLAAVFLFMLPFAALDYRALKNSWPLVFGITLAALALVLIIGTDQFGARRWFRLAFFDFQPGEMAKVTLAIVIAQIISSGHGRRPYLATIAISGAVVAPCVFLIMRQPNLSTALTIVFMWLVMIFVGGLARQHVTLIGTVALVLVILFVGLALFPSDAVETNEQAAAARAAQAASAPAGAGATPAPAGGLIRDYQVKRFETLLFGGQPGESYQSEQALIALGSGGLIGKGYLKGTQTQLRYFPVRHTDFIFSVVGEELGFAGAALSLALLLVVILRTLRAALRARDGFGRLLCVGIAAVFFLQTYINIGMQIGWAPVTGVVLPFISYGRTSLATVLLAIGLVQGVAMRHQDPALLRI